MVIPNCLSADELGEIAKIIQTIRASGLYKTPFKTTESYRAQFEQYLNPRLIHDELNMFVSHREIMKNVYSILSFPQNKIFPKSALKFSFFSAVAHRSHRNTNVF